MKCPACQTRFDTPPVSCPKCATSLWELDRKFLPVPVHFGNITDTGFHLTNSERHRAEVLFRWLEARYPQVRFSLFVTDLPNRPAREYGFWLFNRCRFFEAEMRAERNFGLLLLVNPSEGESVLMAGYGLEEVLSEEDLERALDPAVPFFADGDIFGGVRACVREVDRILGEVWARAVAPPAAPSTLSPPATPKTPAAQTTPVAPEPAPPPEKP